MTPHFHVVMVRHQTGERIPILLDVDRQPITWINMYLLLRLRPRLASSSQEKALYVLGLFWAWCSMQTIPVRERLESGDGLTPEEIVSRLYPWLRHSFQSRGSVRQLVVSPNTVAYRMRVISQFITWHLENAMAKWPVGSPEIGQIRAKLQVLQRTFASTGIARTELQEHATALSSDELASLVEICRPGSDGNPWKPAYQPRNYLILLLMATLGLRRGEVLKLRMGDCLLSRPVPMVQIRRSPDDPDDPRLDEPQVKTESRILPCDMSLARLLDDYICSGRREIAGSDRTPFLFLARSGQPMSLFRVNGILDQIGAVHPQFRDLHPHALRTTCATLFRAQGVNRGLDEDRIDKNMMYFFGWRSPTSIRAYIADAIRKEASEISLSYQASLLGTVRRS
ncbi:tyrosine-type recombinase/integrase [Cupriavidus sp. KB_39]|uniref:tyrosine-type recombinase/integrase n=1 Tax=Cupriavidus sp. KB_39 TaxID=3233036 RepID=UPI003F908A17